MRYDYGYIDGALGADGDSVDVYLGPDETAQWVYAVHQNKVPDFTTYDEDKVMLGWSSADAARDAYVEQYDDPRFFGGMSMIPVETASRGAVSSVPIRPGCTAGARPRASCGHLDGVSLDGVGVAHRLDAGLTLCRAAELEHGLPNDVGVWTRTGAREHGEVHGGHPGPAVDQRNQAVEASGVERLDGLAGYAQRHG